MAQSRGGASGGWLSFFLTAATVLAEPGGVAAQEKTPIPEFTGQRLVTADVDAAPYQPLQGQIAQIEAGSKQTYYVVVVRSSGAGPTATRDYTDALYQQWTTQAAARGLKLDPDRSVVMLLATDNRQLSVHAGAVLQKQYGLLGETIDRRLVAPHFIPQAKAGNYPEGLKALLREIEGWIVARDQEEARRQAEAAERAKRIEEDAWAAVAAATTLAGDVRKLLVERAESGTPLAHLTKRVDDADAGLAAARGLIATDAAGALQRAAGIQASLVEAQNEIRQWAALQSEATAAVANLRTLAGRVSEAIDGAAREKLPVSAETAQLDGLNESIGELDRLVAQNPRDVISRAALLSASLQGLLDQVTRLPTLKKAALSHHDNVRPLLKTHDEALEKGIAAGAVPAPMKAESEKLQKQFQAAEALMSVDVAKAIDAFRALEPALKIQTGRITRETADTIFRTRTLPMLIVCGLLAAVALVFVLLRLMHVVRRRALEARLKEFKQQVVGISDRIDAMKERHRMLTFTDPDFTQPMTGQTLAAWEGVQTALERHRERWLVLMDVWEQSQRLLESETFFGRSRLNNATAMLKDPQADDTQKAIEGECVAILDQLQNAHEQAAEVRKQLDGHLSQLKGKLEQLGQRGISAAPYDAPCQAAMQLRQQAEGVVTADPLGAAGLLTQACDTLSRTGRRVEQVFKLVDGHKELVDTLAQTVRTAEDRRREGYRFCEAGADPNPHFEQAGKHAAECRRQLDLGEPDAANEQLKKGTALVAKAAEQIEGQVRARGFCRTESAARRQELERLRQSLTEARTNHEELRRNFAATSWREVADLPEQARATLEQCATLLQSADAAASDDVQQFAQATTLLGQAQELQKRAAGAAAAVAQRLILLRQERDKCRAHVEALRQSSERLAALLRQSTEDRPQSNQRFQRAMEQLQQAIREAATPMAEWPVLTKKLEAIQSEFATAERMAQEDIRLADAARREIAETEREIRAAGSFYRHGFSADVSAASSQLGQARNAYQQQNYEEAIRLANVAETAARSARADAERRAEERQRQIDRQRQLEMQRQAEMQRQQAIGTGAAVGALMSTAQAFSSPQAAAAPMPAGAFVPPSPSPMPSAAPVPSPAPAVSTTSTSDWSSGTSQSSW